MKSVLLAVIANAGQFYPQLVASSLATWDTAEVPGVETVFYFDREYKGGMPKTIAVNGAGDLHSMGRRNLLAFDWFLKNRSWDYMARVNASTYVRKQTLLNYVQDIPTSGLYRGLVTDAPHGGKYCWGGGGFIISRDVVEKIVANGHKMDHREMEDVSLGKLVQECGVTLDGLGRMCSIDHQPVGYVCIVYDGHKGGGFNFADFDDMNKMDYQHFIRVKQEGQRPHGDIRVMQELHKIGL